MTKTACAVGESILLVVLAAFTAGCADTPSTKLSTAPNGPQRKDAMAEKTRQMKAQYDAQQKKAESDKAKTEAGSKAMAEPKKPETKNSSSKTKAEQKEDK